MTENKPEINEEAIKKVNAPQEVDTQNASTPISAAPTSSVDVGVTDGFEARGVDIPETIALLPLRDMVLFPTLVAPLNIQRDSTLRLIDDVVATGDRVIGVVALHDATVEKPTAKDIYPIGCAVVIRMMGKSGDGVRLLVQGVHRLEILQVTQEEPYIKARVRVLPSEGINLSADDKLQVEALKRQITNAFTRIIQLSAQMPDEMQELVNGIEDASSLTDIIAAHLPIGVPDKQKVLETKGLLDRMNLLLSLMTKELQVLEIGNKLQSQVATEINKTQRDYYLREQLKAIQKELGEGEEGRASDLEELKAKIEEAHMTEEAHKEATREFGRLERMSPNSPEYTVSRSYLDWLVALPWDKSTDDNLDIAEVARVLDEDHFGLGKIKDRILEYLSVRKFRADGKSRQPILCLVGPPGVGKTSLAKSIARAMGKKFVRISLGGVRDEAEIRGHRRTYIGSMPGQVIQGIKRAGSNNPIFILDEIDKVAADYRGDPSSALLEVLDPEQNSSFRDNYLDVTFDLSKVMFVTTANMLDTIQPALRDRMEIIELTGYTEEEKTQIAIRHLVPKQLAEHGLSEGQVEFTSAGIKTLISGYTREAGVRSLERQIAAVCRKATRELAMSNVIPSEVEGTPTIHNGEVEGTPTVISTEAEKSVEAEGNQSTLGQAVQANGRTILPPVSGGMSQGDRVGLNVLIDSGKVVEYLGMPRFEHDEAKERSSVAGVATGLVWTPVGGDIVFIESSKMPGSKGLQLTGQLGDVMKESAQTALSYLRAHASDLNIAADFYDTSDLHVHVPAGATPKDGPSAGVTMTTALASLLTGRPIKPLLAMTGEVTLSGKVLPVGGIKEKVLAAKRAGINTVILPERNRKDLYEDIPADQRQDMDFIFATDVSQVIAAALTPLAA